MIWRTFADLMLVLHLAFIVLAVFGGWVVLRRPRFIWVRQALADEGALGAARVALLPRSEAGGLNGGDALGGEHRRPAWRSAVRVNLAESPNRAIRPGDGPVVWAKGISGRGGLRLGRCEFLPSRYETNLDALVESGGNTPQHGERVPFIVVVFEARNDRAAGANELGKLCLSETGSSA